ncbi:MAG: hypothetical protein PVI23_14550 [Maricaulaceae bacterium]|jgi:hypothetical protein
MSRPETDPCSEDDASLPALWEAARYLLHCLKAVFGGPCAIAGLGVLALKEYQDIAGWLAPIEKAVRRLLLIEAAAIAPDLTPAPPRPAQPAPKAAGAPRNAVTQDEDNSADWRVRFDPLPHVRASKARRDSAQSAVPAAGRTFESLGVHCAWPLAERAEAVARVLDNPAPHVRRLALRLARGLNRNGARLADRAAALGRPPDRPPPTFGRWVNENAQEQAADALAAFDTS